MAGKIVVCIVLMIAGSLHAAEHPVDAQRLKFHNALLAGDAGQVLHHSAQAVNDEPVDGVQPHNPLRIAIEAGDLEMVRELLARETTVQGFDARNGAVACSNVAIIQELMRRGADVNSINLVRRAVDLKNVDFLEELLSRHPDILVKNPLISQNILRGAVSQGDLDVVKVLLKYDIGFNVHDRDFVYEAISSGNAGILNALISKGLKLDPRCTTFIQAAFKSGNMEMVKVLFNHGAQFNPNDRDLLHRVISSSSIEIFEIFIKRAKIDPRCYPVMLHGAIESRNLEVLQALFQAGVNIQPDNKYLLRQAVFSGDMKILQELLRQGANGVDNGRGAAHEAVHSRNLPMLQELLRHGTPVDQTDAHGHTPLDLLVRDPHADFNMAQLLISHRATVRSTKPQAKRRFEDVLRMCETIRDGKIPKISNLHRAIPESIHPVLPESTMIPLCEAVTAGNLVAVQLLLALGAHPNGNKSSNKPLYQAVLRNDPPIMQALINAGADIAITTPDEKSVLDFARERNAHPAIVGLLDPAMRPAKLMTPAPTYASVQAPAAHAPDRARSIRGSRIYVATSNDPSSYAGQQQFQLPVQAPTLLVTHIGNSHLYAEAATHAQQAPAAPWVCAHGVYQNQQVIESGAENHVPVAAQRTHEPEYVQELRQLLRNNPALMPQAANLPAHSR